MSTAVIDIQIEVNINDTDEPNDKGLNESEIANIACGGIVEGIKQNLERSKRNGKVTKAIYTHTIVEHGDLT